ncbi:hypothetical protein GCM10023116_24550 [Kistimonas scapharcae]|uniref:Solute-binding protein family 3/N-terminal domain-containing protein n=1 Tax=Kistimonas scapharcae TaxID=1036133 RepID=A0ABP8V2Q6_9GAMM
MSYANLFIACLVLFISPKGSANPEGIPSAPEQPHGLKETTFHLTQEEQTYLQKKKQIRLCVDPHWLPMEGINDAGEFEGFVADYIALLQAKTGLNIELYPTRTWADSLKAARNRDCDILSSPITPARKEFMLFTLNSRLTI